MATKREMAERLMVLGEQLGTFFPTAGLNHSELEQLLVETEAKAAEKAQQQPGGGETAQAGGGDEGTGANPAGLPSTDVPAVRYRVGKGALTSPRGILKPGEPLRPGDVTGDALQILLKARLVVVDTRELASEPGGPSGS